MTAGGAGLGYASIDLTFPKIKLGPSMTRCPGAEVKVDDWHLAGVVLRVPANWSFEPDAPTNGVAYAGPITGYTGVLRGSKTSISALKFPGTREAEMAGFNKEFFNAIFALYCQDTKCKNVPKHHHNEVFNVGVVTNKLRAIHPISVSPFCKHLYGFQWTYSVKMKLAKEKPKKLKGYAERLKDMGVRLRLTKTRLQPYLGVGVTAGWRAWCVAGCKRGNVFSIVKSFVDGIPDNYKIFDKFWYAGEFHSI